MVVVEPGVHAAELRQAHRHVAVVEDHRDAEPLAQIGGDPTEVRHRNGEDDHRVHVLLLLEHLRQVPAPARGDPTPDRLARSLVEHRVVGALLRAAEVAVALEPGEPASNRRVALALDAGRVRRRPPPGRLDRLAPVRRHDQVDTDLVQPLPELPPRRRAAVAEVEVDRGRDREDLRRLHPGQHRGGS